MDDSRLYTYRARLKRVVDGDTVDLECDIGFGGTMTVRCRLVGVDTAERGDDRWEDAKEFVECWMIRAFRETKDEWPLRVKTAKLDGFRRWLAEKLVRVSDGADLADAIRAAGFDEV